MQTHRGSTAGETDRALRPAVCRGRLARGNFFERLDDGGHGVGILGGRPPEVLHGCCHLRLIRCVGAAALSAFAAFAAGLGTHVKPPCSRYAGPIFASKATYSIAISISTDQSKLARQPAIARSDPRNLHGIPPSSPVNRPSGCS